MTQKKTYLKLFQILEGFDKDTIIVKNPCKANENIIFKIEENKIFVTITDSYTVSVRKEYQMSECDGKCSINVCDDTGMQASYNMLDEVDEHISMLIDIINKYSSASA